MSNPKIVLRPNRAYATEVRTRHGGYCIPVHGVDSDGYALDPHGEIPAQVTRYHGLGKYADHDGFEFTLAPLPAGNGPIR